MDFVIDRYPVVSIKTGECFCRLRERGTIRVRILSAIQKIPLQWKKFPGNARNKENLHFLAEECFSQSYVVDRLAEGGELFVTDDIACFRLPCDTARKLLKQDVPELQCNHEEADI